MVYRVLQFFLPCFQVAELFGDDFAQVDAEAVDDALRQVGVRRAAENLDVRHPALENQILGPGAARRICRHAHGNRRIVSQPYHNTHEIFQKGLSPKRTSERSGGGSLSLGQTVRVPLCGCACNECLRAGAARGG